MDDQSKPPQGGSWTPAPQNGAAQQGQAPQQGAAPQQPQQPRQPPQSQPQGQPFASQAGPQAPSAQPQNDWGTAQSPPGQAPMAQTGFTQPKSGLADGIGTLDDSTALFPEIKASVGQFFGLLKGPIMFALIALTGAQLLVYLLSTLAAMILTIAELDGMLMTGVHGITWLVGSILSVVVMVYQVALFRPANDQVTGFTQEPPESMMAAIKISSPALLPVFLACLMCGGMIAAGSFFCLIPGVIAFVALFPMRYLSATRPDFTEYKFMKVLESSMMLGKKYWAVMLAAGFTMGMVAAAGGVINAITGVISGLANVAVLNSMTSFVGASVVTSGITATVQVIGWLVTLAMVMIGWVIEGGVMSVLARHEDLVNQ